VSRFASERLASRHDSRQFRCGVEALDRWLIDHATHMSTSLDQQAE
jgi:hypothetical protein